MPPHSNRGYGLATARLIKKELLSIRKKYGRITPENVVEYARPKTNPLHRFFDWDDSTAAEKYRLVQASAMVRRVQVYVQCENERMPVRVFCSIKQDGQREYQPTIEILGDAEKRAQVLRELKQDVEAMIRRYDKFRFCSKALRLLRAALSVLDVDRKAA